MPIDFRLILDADIYTETNIVSFLGEIRHIRYYHAALGSTKKWLVSRF